MNTNNIVELCLPPQLVTFPFNFLWKMIPEHGIHTPPTSTPACGNVVLGFNNLAASPLSSHSNAFSLKFQLAVLTFVCLTAAAKSVPLTLSTPLPEAFCSHVHMLLIVREALGLNPICLPEKNLCRISDSFFLLSHFK